MKTVRPTENIKTLAELVSPEDREAIERSIELAVKRKHPDSTIRNVGITLRYTPPREYQNLVFVIQSSPYCTNDPSIPGEEEFYRSKESGILTTTFKEIGEAVKTAIKSASCYKPMNVRVVNFGERMRDSQWAAVHSQSPEKTRIPLRLTSEIDSRQRSGNALDLSALTDLSSRRDYAMLIITDGYFPSFGFNRRDFERRVCSPIKKMVRNGNRVGIMTTCSPNSSLFGLMDTSSLLRIEGEVENMSYPDSFIPRPTLVKPNCYGDQICDYVARVIGMAEESSMTEF